MAKSKDQMAYILWMMIRIMPILIAPIHSKFSHRSIQYSLLPKCIPLKSKNSNSSLITSKMRIGLHPQKIESCPTKANIKIQVWRISLIKKEKAMNQDFINQLTRLLNLIFRVKALQPVKTTNNSNHLKNLQKIQRLSIWEEAGNQVMGNLLPSI